MQSPTLIEILNKTAEHFKQKRIENFRLDAQLLLGHVLSLDRVALYLNYDRPLSQREIKKCREVVRRRAAREPLQHILGEIVFRELTLKVDKRAMIPRRETELIVDLVKEAAGALKAKPVSILEIGVGSGAIFLSLKKELAHEQIQGVELSREALELARSNASLNGFTADESLWLGDTFQPFSMDRQWNIIVSNPPYVSEKDFGLLEPEVRLWDPREALLGGTTGLEYPSRLIHEAYQHLTQPGFLVMEIGDNQSEVLLGEALKSGWRNSSVKLDYAEKERFIIFQK